jgi:hypothetical protein
MPPKGFDTVTLPTDVIETLDEIGRKELADPSRPAVVRMLISDYRAGGDAEAIDYAEIERRCERAVQNTLEGRR